MDLSRFNSRSGQLTLAQIVSLAVSGLLFFSGNMTPAMAFLVIATFFGVMSAIRKYREARRDYPELFVKRPKRQRRRQ